MSNSRVIRLALEAISICISIPQADPLKGSVLVRVWCDEKCGEISAAHHTETTMNTANRTIVHYLQEY